MPGLSCTGIHVRARIAWLWVKRKGALSPWASTHNNASAPGSEVYCMATFFAPVEIGMLKGRPRKGWASPRENSRRLAVNAHALDGELVGVKYNALCVSRRFDVVRGRSRDGPGVKVDAGAPV